jgi:histidine ammonia-lyase
METFYYGKNKLTIKIAIEIAKGNCKGVLLPETIELIQKSADSVQQIIKAQKTVYGINTGFGPLCDSLISETDTKLLQHNLLISHAVGVGNPINTTIAKLMLICKVQALCYGFSGVTVTVIERVIWHVNNNIIPFVPEKGSVGASGDLAPLAHLFLPLIGLGKVYCNGVLIDTIDCLKTNKIEPLSLQAKEGLGLINGTQFILAHAVWALYQMEHLLNVADVAGAMSLEAFMGSSAPFKKELHNIRNYQGSQLVAERLRHILDGSEILNSHTNCERVQDPYSLRCMPQVHGASRNAWQHLYDLVAVELNSVTDNPIILSSNETISGGNFHGQLLAMAIDYVTIAAAELGNISDRRCYLLLEGKYGLPKLLMTDTGLNSGFMIPQYTTAALVTENKTLCFPASADSIPTSLGQEDHVSMGSISGRKLIQVLQNVEYIYSIELLYAAQGVDLRHPLKSSPYLTNIHKCIRGMVPFATADRQFQFDINAIHEWLINENNFSLFQ